MSKSLLETCNITTGKLDSNAATIDGKYPFFTCAPDPLRIDNYAFDDDVILLAGNNAQGNFHIARYTGKFNAYQRTYVITAKDQFDIDFIKYSIELSLNHLKKVAQGSQTKFLTMGILEQFEVNNIPYDKQKEQVSCLVAIDKKIALNNRVNATLEAMAKTLYDYWFVQFDFPDEKGRPYKTSGGKMVYNEELGREVPAGWEVKQLSDFVEISTDSENPSDNPQTLYEHYSIPAYDEAKYPSMERGDTINSSKYIVKPTSLLYAKLNPAFKRLWAPFCFSEHAICSTEFIVLELRERDNYGFVYSVLNDSSFQRYMEKQASSSTGSRKRVQPDNGLRYSLVRPPEIILKRFSVLYEAIIQRNKTLIIESHRLAALRDWLLPMLMNGQVGFKGDC